MKFQSIAIILFLAAFIYGCDLTDKFRGTSNANSNVFAAAPAPNASLTPNASSEVKTNDSNDALAELGRNYLAFGAGTKISSVSSESKAGSERARNLIDEAQFDGWKTEVGAVENQNVVLELPARTTFETFTLDVMVFNQYDGAAPLKDFSIEVSDVSPTEGFQTVVESTVKQGNKTDLPPQIFPVSKQIPARWVRFTAKSRYGEGKRIFTRELRGYGEQEPIATLQNITGSYEFYGGAGEMTGEKMQIKQDGTSVVGCIGGGEYMKIIEGGIEGRNVTLKYYYWNKTDEKNSGVMIFTPDAKSLNFSYWLGEGKKSYDTLTPGRKTSDTPGKCPKMPGFDDGGRDAVKETLEKKLADTGRAVLYGINFDFNSDVIKPESKPTLDKVAAIMKEKSDWKFSIEGHTDNVGGSSFNQTLSEKRAASVLKYLTNAGIASNRLSSAGFGLSKPVAGNDTETGRAQNRRVELIKQ